LYWKRIGNARTILPVAEEARVPCPAAVSLIRKSIPLLFLLGGCSQVPILPGLTPYKMDIQQGNYVTQDMVAKLKPGMTRAQVRFALGTPLVVDPFHTDRWDYVYVLRKNGKIVEQRRLIVLFQDEKLLRLEGDVTPAAQAGRPEAVPSAAASAKP
jgi:outer membrane protein assembly factor BamE